MGESKIEWTEHTWNPFAGCAVLSPGCTNCYAMKMAARLDAMGQALYQGLTKTSKAGPVWRGTIRANPDALLAPLRRKKPTTYFVNSMSDLFYEKFDDELIDQVFAVMALSPQHTFQVLTKRAERMRDYFVKPVQREGMIDCVRADRVGDVMLRDHQIGSGFKCVSWPLPNVWLGVSAERQQEADERIPHLLRTPAAVRFVSCEPLLGQIYLTRCERGDATVDALVGESYYPGAGSISSKTLKGKKLDWVIVGGESGTGARPMHPDWARSLRDQCAASGANFFFKQWGSWHPEIDRDRDDPDWRQPYPKYKEPAFQILNLAGGRGFHGDRVHVMRSCSKKSAGRLLDGQEHNGMPGRAA